MRKLYRSDKEKWIAGVLGGLGEYLSIDPTLLRIAFIILTFATGGFPGIVGYILAVFIIPKKPLGYQAPAAATTEAASASNPPPRDSAQSTASDKPGNAPLVIGIVLIGLGVLFLLNNFLYIRWHLLWPLILIALGLILLGKAVMGSKN
jgi:phage shock protein C